MIFSYSWLKDYLKGKVPQAKAMAELLCFHSFEIEGVTKKGRDWLLDIDVLPNRAHDCFSHLGIAKEVSVLCGCRFEEPLIKSKIKYQKFAISIKVENSQDCPRYTAQLIAGVKVGDSPKWMQERLKACGLQPINNIVDATNYVMLETGQPIHAFDFDKIKSIQTKKIIVRRAKEGETIKTLDQAKTAYKLDKNILVIADSEKPIAIAGIKGGVDTGIDKNTKNIIVEAANFNPVLTRRASQKLKLRTDASMRFEHEIDPNLIDQAQQRAAYLIQKTAKGDVAAGLVDFYPKKVLPKTIKLDLVYLNELLGVVIPQQKVIQILKSLGFSIKENKTQKSLLVNVPTIRLDLQIQEDLIEEVGRVYGYKSIPANFPNVSLAPPKVNEQVLWENKAKDCLKELGFCEAYNYSFVSDTIKEIFHFSVQGLVEIENPMSGLNKYLRPSLIPHLLNNVRDNLRFFDEVKMFEIGKIFQSRGAKKAEKTSLGIALARKSGKDESFYELKGAVEGLLNSLGLSDVWYDEAGPTPEESDAFLWQINKCAEVKVGDMEIGFLGQIHSDIASEVGIKEKVYLIDLDFEKLIELASEENEYEPISIYPASLRDIAVLVPSGTKVSKILNIIDTVGGNIVKDVDLFDTYSGENLPQGRENLAFHIVYQSNAKTLSATEVDLAHQKIIQALEQNPDFEIRK